MLLFWTQSNRSSPLKDKELNCNVGNDAYPQKVKNAYQEGQHPEDIHVAFSRQTAKRILFIIKDF